MVEIKNRWALITGASRGVGVHVARALAQEGCRVILHSRKVENTAAIHAELVANGSEVYSVEAELSDLTEVDQLVQEVTEISSDHLDILYNNAALMTPSRPLFEPSVDDYQLSFLVNTIVPTKLCDAFIPGMLERDWGRIVNVSSGIIDQPKLMAYSCSKAALDRYVRDMIPTLKGSNVLMNLLDPGWLRTDMGGEAAPNDASTVLPGALVPVLLEKDRGSGTFFEAQNYRES